jgi:hypothetical protein
MIVLQDDDGACLGVSKANLILREPAVWSYYYTLMISLSKIIAMVTIIIVICVFLSTRVCNRLWWKYTLGVVFGCIMIPKKNKDLGSVKMKYFQKMKKFCD